MRSTNYYSMTDKAIAEELGGRLEQLRLEANIPQKVIANELGIAEGTLRNALRGRGKLELIIGILRILGKLDNLDQFLPRQPFSPIELLKLEGKKRQRAGTKRNEASGGESQEQEEW